MQGEQSSRDKYFEQRHLVDILTDFSEFKLPLTTVRAFFFGCRCLHLDVAIVARV